MVGILSNEHLSAPWSQEYTPESFGLDRKTVYGYRNNMFVDDEVRQEEWTPESNGIFLYSWTKRWDTTWKENGWYYFWRAAESEEYFNKVTKVEGEILGAYPQLWKHLSNLTNHIELGPWLWSANKFKNYILPLFKRKKEKKYTHYGFDVSWSVAEKLPPEYEGYANTTWEGIASDWFKTELFEKIDDKAYYILWGSIGNYEEEEVIKLLQRLTSDRYDKWRPIVVTHFLAPSEPDKEQKKKDVCAQYKTPEVKDFIFKGLDALDIDTTQLELAVQYEDWKDWKPDRIKVGAKLLEDMEIEVGNGIYRNKKAGEYIWPISSRRYTTQQFAGLAEKAWCKMEKSRSKEGMSISLLKSSPKKVPEHLQVIWLTTITILALLAIWIGVWWWLERSKQEKKQHKSREDSFIWTAGNREKLQYVLNYNEQEAAKVIWILENRYGAELDSEQKNILLSLFYDRIRKNPRYQYRPAWYAAGQLYDYRLVVASFIDRFVWEYRNTLVNFTVGTTPNSRLLQYKDALSNAYFYTGPRQEFHDVDAELPDYISPIVGADEKGVPNYGTYKVGIKKIWDIPYMVVKINPDEPYILDQWQSLTYGYGGFDAHSVVADIIQQGEVPLLAENIRRYLTTIYGDQSMLLAMNWQDEIAQYITDLYAKWYNLSYLIWANNEQDIYYYYYNDDALKNFVLSYVIPAIWNKLKDGWSARMFDLDWEEIEKGTSEQPPLKDIINRTAEYLYTYIWCRNKVRQGEVENVILKELLLNQSLDHLKNEWDIRCWLTENREKFLSLGINIPAFPDWVEEHLWYNESDTVIIIPRNVTPWVQEYRAEGGNKIFIANGWVQEYVMGDGSRIFVWNLGNRKKVKVGKKVTPMQREILYKEYLDGKYWTFKRTSNYTSYKGVSMSYPVTTEEEIVYILTAEYLPYTSSAIYDMLDDYRVWKTQMEAYKSAKGQ